MTSVGPQYIASRDNALLKDLRRLAQDSSAYRKQGRVWLEGDHLCRAALQRGAAQVVALEPHAALLAIGAAVLRQAPQLLEQRVVAGRNELRTGSHSSCAATGAKWRR